MATRYIQKVAALADLLNLPTAGGIGIYGGKVYMNLGGNVSAISNAPAFGNTLLVDYDHGSATDTRLPYSTIQLAVAAAAHGDTILVRARDIDTAGVAAGTADDPPGYLGDITITAGLDGLRLVGVGNGTSQMGQPCIRKGTTTTNPLITIEAPGVLIDNFTINGAGATGGGIKLLADGSAKDAGGAIISGCHFKNCKSTAAANTGGAIYWSAGSCWYVTIANNDFFDCRCGIGMLSTSISVPRDLKILGNRFYSAVNTTVDADIYVAADGVLGLVIDGNVFGTVDVPAYATSPTAARYISLGAGTAGVISNNVFACISQGTNAKTFGAAGDACIVPTTVRMAGNYGEPASDATGDSGDVFRT